MHLQLIFKKEHDILGARALTQQPDAPDFAGQITEPGANFQIIPLEKGAVHGSLVHAVGNRDGVELRQSRFIDKKREPHRLGGRYQSLVNPCMPDPSNDELAD